MLHVQLENRKDLGCFLRFEVLVELLRQRLDVPALAEAEHLHGKLKTLKILIVLAINEAIM
jgi:hypothetical protein